MGSLDMFADSVRQEEATNRADLSSGSWWDRFTGKTQQKFDFANYQHMLDVFDYQKGLQKQIFSREDNAIQRRSADLEAAGLSKTLAAGSAAKAGAPIGVNAPQMSSHGADKMGQLPLMAMTLAKGKADVSQTSAQTALLRANKQKVKEEISFMKDNNPQRIRQNEIKTWIAEITKKTSVDQMQQNLQNTRYRNTIAHYEIDLQTEKLIRSYLETEMKQKDVKIKDIELLTKAFAYEIQKYNTSMYAELGLPTNAGMSDMYRLGSTANTAVNTATERIKDFLRSLK